MGTSPAPPEASREAGFRSLYDRTYADLLRFVQRRVHPSHAEDVVADVYLVAWRRYADLPTGHEEQRAWLFGVARHSLLNARRSRDRHRSLAVRIAEVGASGAATSDDAELVTRQVDVAAAWPRLSTTDQEALALAVWDGLTAAEAAAVLHISAVAFRLRLSRARRALRRHLGDLEVDSGRTDHHPISALPEGDTP